MAIEQFVPYHPLWPDFVAHLRRMDMAQWVLDDENRARPAHYFFGSVVENHVVGHIAIKMQLITIPSDGQDPVLDQPLCAPDGRPLRESYVQTFAVEPTHRRQGHGRALQLAALDMSARLGCYQMRSWASLDKTANHVLKIALGFTAHPATCTASDGSAIPVVYFIKRV